MIERRRSAGFLHDERGSRSSARLLLWLELAYVWGLGLLETFSGLEVSGPVWALHASLTIALVAWAAGPRAMQYLGPQVAGVARGIAQAAKRRIEGTDNRYTDDER